MTVKDEFNFAKRLNLTSHESGRSLEGESRLPVILPIVSRLIDRYLKI